jgi:haloacetate dehalogenase
VAELSLAGALDGFETVEVETGETNIFVRWSGSGAPILLLHGFPQTHLMWRGVAPLLARRFTVVCADLRGYGRSGCPESTPDHAPYSKRAMARDMVVVMERLAFPRFSVAGHDRGGRVAYRLALDHPGRVERLAVLDVLPTGTVWERADARFALAYWPWSLLAQPEPLPERLIEAAPDAVVDDALAGWGSLLRPSLVRRFAPRMSMRCTIPFGSMPSARSIGPRRPSIGRMTRRTTKVRDASAVRSWHSGVAADH